MNEDVVNVRSLEKRSNQLKYKEPKTRSPKTTAKLIQNNVYCFFITIFRLAKPAFFRFTDVTDVTSMLADLPHLTWRTLSNRNLRLAGFRTTLYSVAEFLKLVWGPPDPPRPPSPLKINSQFDDSELI